MTEKLKDLDLILTHNEGDILLGEIIEMSCSLGEVLDKATVEVGKSEEFPQFFKRFWHRPVGDSLDLR